MPSKKVKKDESEESKKFYGIIERPMPKEVKSDGLKKLVLTIQEPTIKLEVNKVLGGRAPKTEMSLKVSGDLEEIEKVLDDGTLTSVCDRLESLFKEKLGRMTKEFHSKYHELGE